MFAWSGEGRKGELHVDISSYKPSKDSLKVFPLTSSTVVFHLVLQVVTKHSAKKIFISPQTTSNKTARPLTVTTKDMGTVCLSLKAHFAVL